MDVCPWLIIIAFLLGAGAQALPQRTQLAKILTLLVELHQANGPGEGGTHERES